MREKTLRAVVTFATTSDAMAMEAAAKQHALPGRIIPVPSEIDAGCGLAWCADVAERARLVEGLERFALAYEGVYEVLLF